MKNEFNANIRDAAAQRPLRQRDQPHRGPGQELLFAFDLWSEWRTFPSHPSCLFPYTRDNYRYGCTMLTTNECSAASKPPRRRPITGPDTG